eukprot:TRINITY_DN16778_c0_g1_i1.p1 TRINITY_DN16778_c0_g1~~TRINITY_DN16778_c0_g1_i1.p1  ORF type:complete len:250 (+),score=86.48 TRINITY_DN16778_c0_g1_i1:88-750(+)
MEEDLKSTKSSGDAAPPAVIFPSRFVGEGSAKPEDTKAGGVPGQAPEGKTLYEQLKANNEKLNAVYEERMKAAFMPPKPLDDEEIQFLQEYETLAKVKKLEAEIEDSRELETFYQKQAEVILKPEVLPTIIAPPKKEPVAKPKKPLIKVMPVDKSNKRSKDEETTDNSNKKSKTTTTTTTSATPKSSSTPTTSTSKSAPTTTTTSAASLFGAYSDSDEDK